MIFLQKGRKGSGAPIGSLKMFGGREYIKTSVGWKYHGKGRGKKATEHRESSQQPLENEEIRNFKKENPSAKVKNIPLDWFKEHIEGWNSITRDLNPREKKKTDHFKTMSSANLPPVIVANYGNGWRILDGWHRISAAIDRGDTHIPAYTKDSTTESSNGPTADDMLKHPNTKQALKDLGWGKKFLAKTKNYKPDTYYRVEGTGLGYTGAGQGMYVGRDKDALKRFYDMEGEGFEVVEFKGQPKWLNLMDPDEHAKFEQEAKQKYGEDDPSVANHMKKLAQERGYDGIRYYDPYATGEEFVLFDTKKLQKQK